MSLVTAQEHRDEIDRLLNRIVETSINSASDHLDAVVGTLNRTPLNYGDRGVRLQKAIDAIHIAQRELSAIQNDLKET